MEVLALKIVNALNIGKLHRRKNARGHNQKLTAGLLTVVAFYGPLAAVLIKHRRVNTGVELNVVAQTKLVGNVVEISKGLGLAGEVLTPVPLLE